MRQKLQAWLERLLATNAPQDGEIAIDIELLIPISQLYGLEYFPSIHRYREK